MSLTVRALELSVAERAACERSNAALALVPRLKPDGWRLAASQWLTQQIGPTAGRVTAAWLKRKGVTVETRLAGAGPHAVPARILRPAGQPRAAVLDIHGGGWVVGSAGLNDTLNAHLAAEAGLAVVSVDYRLLNESRGIGLDQAVGDCVAAARWFIAQAPALFGTDRLFLVGESAGGHLAALTALALRDEGRFGGFVGCVFIYGVFDLGGTPSVHAAGPEALLLNGPTLAADLARLTPNRDAAGRRRPDVSPLHADLTSLPPALFIAGDLDPLRDDSHLMAQAWARVAPAELLTVPIAPHGFMHFGGAPAVKSRQILRDWLKTRLSAACEPVSVENRNH